jgi:hypothetical protein
LIGFTQRIWLARSGKSSRLLAGYSQIQARLFATYWREYENFTHLPYESIDTMFQRFMMIVNNLKANVTMLLYDDHDKAVKLLHLLDHTIWGRKVEVILELGTYVTLMVDELFSKLKSSKVDRGLATKIQGPTDSHGLALVRGSGARSNANPSSKMYSLSSFDVFAK